MVALLAKVGAGIPRWSPPCRGDWRIRYNKGRNLMLNFLPVLLALLVSGTISPEADRSHVAGREAVYACTGAGAGMRAKAAHQALHDLLAQPGGNALLQAYAPLICQLLGEAPDSGSPIRSTPDVDDRAVPSPVATICGTPSDGYRQFVRTRDGPSS